ncbi:Rv1733c family protein [Saccharothrix deserti]|uniref:Rv1733c family protein n=1 Tax=Saccharothrix deserti TaxID=2593674 RepID=UPI00131E9DAA|nr:hypothetical protein [Saccharothrix deserti]
MDPRSGAPVPRLVRQVFAWRNPMADLGDRLEGAVAVASVTVTLLGLPIAAAVGSEVYAAQAEASEEQLRDRREVDAVLLGDTPDSAGGNVHDGSAPRSDVPATWTLPDGTTRRGDVEAPGEVPAGGKVRIWVDGTGSPVAPPSTAEGAVVTAAAVATGSWIALGGAAALFYVVVRSAHARIRRRRLESEWAAVEPGWRKLG